MRRSRKFLPGGGGTGELWVLPIVLVNNIFHTGPYRPPSRNDWTTLGPIASRGGSVPEFLRKHIATCDFPGVWRGPLLWIRQLEQGDRGMYNMPAKPKDKVSHDEFFCFFFICSNWLGFSSLLHKKQASINGVFSKREF